MGGLSWWHWLIILGAFVLLFGAKKLPEAARGVGRSLRILKSEVSAMSDDDGRSRDTNGETLPQAVTAPAIIASPVGPANPVTASPVGPAAASPTVVADQVMAGQTPVDVRNS